MLQCLHKSRKRCVNGEERNLSEQPRGRREELEQNNLSDDNYQTGYNSTSSGKSISGPTRNIYESNTRIDTGRLPANFDPSSQRIAAANFTEKYYNTVKMIKLSILVLIY